MSESNQSRSASPISWVLVAAVWLAVGLPAAWGVYRTAVNSAALFHASSTATTASSK